MLFSNKSCVFIEQSPFVICYPRDLSIWLGRLRGTDWSSKANLKVGFISRFFHAKTIHTREMSPHESRRSLCTSPHLVLSSLASSILLQPQDADIVPTAILVVLESIDGNMRETTVCRTYVSPSVCLYVKPDDNCSYGRCPNGTLSYIQLRHPHFISLNAHQHAYRYAPTRT